MSALIVLLGLTSALHAQNLDLNGYIQQVETRDPGLAAAKKTAEGTRLRQGEGDLLTLPTLSVNLQNVVDEKPSTQPNFTGTKSSYNAYSVAVSEATSIGLNAKLGYSLNYRDTVGASPTFLPVPTYHTASPSLEVSQSLWRNGFGSEVRASKALLNSSGAMAMHTEAAKFAAAKLDAQSTYLRLYYARRSLTALKESLSINQKLAGWARGRANEGLSDGSDVLQTQAAVEARNIELSRSEDDLRAAALAFNALRGLDSDSVTEILLPPKVEPNSVTSTSWRSDVRAAIEGAKAAKASGLVNREKYRPTLDLYGSYSMNSLKLTQSEVLTDSFQSKTPTWAVGVKFYTSLALGSAASVREGYEVESEGAEKLAERRLVDQKRDTAELIKRLKTTQERLEMAKSLTASQSKKLNQERTRHQKGRTTLFQVLQFELDYLLAQLNEIRTESELNSLYLQTHLYHSEAL